MHRVSLILTLSSVTVALVPHVPRCAPRTSADGHCPSFKISNHFQDVSRTDGTRGQRLERFATAQGKVNNVQWGKTLSGRGVLSIVLWGQEARTGGSLLPAGPLRDCLCPSAPQAHASTSLPKAGASAPLVVRPETSPPALPLLPLLPAPHLCLSSAPSSGLKAVRGFCFCFEMSLPD